MNKSKDMAIVKIGLFAVVLIIAMGGVSNYFGTDAGEAFFNAVIISLFVVPTIMLIRAKRKAKKYQQQQTNTQKAALLQAQIRANR